MKQKPRHTYFSDSIGNIFEKDVNAKRMRSRAMRGRRSGKKAINAWYAMH
jgi:hypothetical protein